MSRIAFNGNALGTGTFTIASPNSNSDRTVTLPDQTGTLVLSGNSASFTSAAVSGATTTGSLAVNGDNISATNSLGFRNRILNGGMVIDQRNAGASVTGGAALIYPVDRWASFEDTDGVMTFQRSTTAPAGFSYSVVATTTTADASLSASQRAIFIQRIEGFNIADLGWGTASAQTITLSFWVRSSLTGTFGGSLTNTSRSYPFTYTISAANTWEQKTLTIVGDTSGTWDSTNGLGIQVGFGLGCGSNFNGTAGAWAAGDFNSATGATSVIGTLNATWYITGVQLEAGSVASPFERRPYGEMLLLCQRYFETSLTVAPVDNMTTSQTGAFALTGTGTNPALCISFKAQKRADPTITYYAPLTTSPAGKLREGPTGTIRTASTYGVSVWGLVFGALSGANTSDYQFGFYASSEL